MLRGVPRQSRQGHRWESHGMVCEICIDVAQQAMQMHNAGASVAEIRTAIESNTPPCLRTPYPHADTARPARRTGPLSLWLARLRSLGPSRR